MTAKDDNHTEELQYLASLYTKYGLVDRAREIQYHLNKIRRRILSQRGQQTEQESDALEAHS